MHEPGNPSGISEEHRQQFLPIAHYLVDHHSGRPQGKDPENWQYEWQVNYIIHAVGGRIALLEKKLQPFPEEKVPDAIQAIAVVLDTPVEALMQDKTAVQKITDFFETIG